ncbi:MAG: transcriptional regulator [Chloroflexota bacterium]|nr:transcriptional regulator [Chloroflexota bacterium]
MVEEQVRTDFERARHKAFFNELASFFSGRNNQLLSFHEVRSRFKPEGEFYRGMQEVPIRKIVGSMDRFRDFDRAFLPRHAHSAGRWQNVDRAFHQDVRLPPVQLYQVGDVYFVKDGNHRVSVGRERGVEFIDAEVIESHVRVPVNASMTPYELLMQVEYAEFLRLTNLDRLRPEHDIRPSSLGRYDEMWDHILLRHVQQIEQQGADVPIEEAVTDWYDNVYLPIVQIARERQILRRFPNRTEADIYIWAMRRRDDLASQGDEEVDPRAALINLAEELDIKRLPFGLDRFLRKFRRGGPPEP